MTMDLDFAATLMTLAMDRGVYEGEAYFFVMESLEQVMSTQSHRMHIGGEDLLEAIRQLATERYGVMAGDVFNAWGVSETIDFGRIVFHLVEAGVLRKQAQDSLSDFIDKFDFEEAFALKACRGRG